MYELLKVILKLINSKLKHKYFNKLRIFYSKL